MYICDPNNQPGPDAPEICNTYREPCSRRGGLVSASSVTGTGPGAACPKPPEPPPTPLPAIPKSCVIRTNARRNVSYNAGSSPITTQVC